MCRNQVYKDIDFLSCFPVRKSNIPTCTLSVYFTDKSEAHNFQEINKLKLKTINNVILLYRASKRKHAEHTTVISILHIIIFKLINRTRISNKPNSIRNIKNEFPRTSSQSDNLFARNTPIFPHFRPTRPRLRPCTTYKTSIQFGSGINSVVHIVT